MENCVSNKHLKEDTNETVTNCNSLKMKAADGKRGIQALQDQ